MSNINKKIKTDFVTVACFDGDIQQQRYKRKIAKKPAKNLLDLNFDCLFEIFERVDVMDLANVSQSCEFLKKITFDFFQRKYKSLKLDYSRYIISVDQAVQAKLLLKTFGSSIVELDIKFNYLEFDEDDRTAGILHATMTHCTSLKSLKLDSFFIPDDEFWFIRIRKLFARLEKLQLYNFYIRGDNHWYDDDDYDDVVTTPNGYDINCFDNCTSLRELKLFHSSFFYDAIFQNTFPRLQHFIIVESEFSNNISNSINGFILRHPHLKTFSLYCDYNHLPVAAANLRCLETFGFAFDFRLSGPTSVESLAKFRNLKELRCFHVGSEDNMSRLLKILPTLANTLQVLDLKCGRGNLDLLAVVNSLQKLKVVRLTHISIKDTPRDDLKNLLRATTVIFE